MEPDLGFRGRLARSPKAATLNPGIGASKPLIMHLKKPSPITRQVQMPTYYINTEPIVRNIGCLGKAQTRPKSNSPFFATLAFVGKNPNP